MRFLCSYRNSLSSKNEKKLPDNLRSLRSLAISASDKATQRTQSSAEFAKKLLLV